MSTAAASRVATSTAAQTASTNGTNGTDTKQLVPTNNVTFDGITFRARIDPTLTVTDVVKQLCIHLKVKGLPSEYALRDETNDELVNDDNMRKKIKGKINLKLVNAPHKEAKEIVEKLRLRDEKMRLAVFGLQKYIKEPDFTQKFLSLDGLLELVDIIHTTHGNTLAYALSSMQHLMDFDYGWGSLNERFILRIVQILTSSQPLINVSRPATAILKKLVEADPAIVPSQVAGPSNAKVSHPPGSVYRYGFDVVYGQIRKEIGLLETVVDRLGSPETAMAQHSMMLINSLLSHATDDKWEDFAQQLERLNVRRAVVSLMSSHTSEDLVSSIMDFQANMIRMTYRKKMTLVDPTEPRYAADLKFIWMSSKQEEQLDDYGHPLKWRLLGFQSEDLAQELESVGILGLDCFKHFVRRDPDFSKLVLEQLNRPEGRRCPIGKASNEVVELLSEHWAIFAPGYSTSTTFQPFFLDFYKIHSLATHFFIRMWRDSGAASVDFPRVAALVRSQVKVALRRENVRQWHEVEQDFQDSDYRAVRDRQMQELELEDDLLNKVPVRNLRAKIYKESYEFVRQQRIHCLHQGAWFINAIPQGSHAHKPIRPWRFMRLDNAQRYLHYVDSAVKFPVRSGIDDLPERIEVAAISEIATGTCAPPPNVLRDSDDLPPASSSVPSPLSFSLLTAHEGSLADQIAPDQARWADWTDALNMLRRDGGHVASKETAGFVQALTDIGIKIKLLDLSGEMVEIPSGLTAGPPPSNTDFYFSDLM